MTPPASVIIYVALVCIFNDAASETVADHGNKNKHPPTTLSGVLDTSDETLVNNKESYSLAMHMYRTNSNKRTINFNGDSVEVKRNRNNHIVINKYRGIDNGYNRKSNNSNSFRFNNANDLEYHNTTLSRRKRQAIDDVCDDFKYFPGRKMISHPKMSKNNPIYARQTECQSIIDVSSNAGHIISLDFVDIFHIEDHPNCEYDYLEIRDGKYGYSRPVYKFCGKSFPTNVKSTGQYLWLKFHSDDTIEYDGFHINVSFEPSSNVRIIDDSCYIKKTNVISDKIATTDIPKECLAKSLGALDVLWNITTEVNTKIYLNFTEFVLEHPNECNLNYIEVFGADPDIPSRFEQFCGSLANSVITKNENTGNQMYIHLYAAHNARATHFSAIYTALRTIDAAVESSCRLTEFNCEDSTCISNKLYCDGYANCRLKVDEDKCNEVTKSLISQPHILIILIIFSLILSGMTFVFLFKCIRKLVQDHKLIKEHIRQSCEDKLDSLDVRKLHRDSMPPASLERENHTNEMYKKQRSLSQHKPSSIDSDFNPETQIDIDDDVWRTDLKSVAAVTEDVRIERNGRNRRSDFSRKEENLRKESRKMSERDSMERKEIRDASVGAPDTKESGCQTRESLFKTGTASSDGTDSGSGGRAFSTFGYSGATIARPSPPAPIAASEITIELMKSYSPHESKPKKLPDRRPMSNETTRSAPDVIIVSKPIR